MPRLSLLLALALLAGCSARNLSTPGPVPAPGLGNAASLVRMGDEMRNAGDPGSAAGFYQGAAERDPSDPVPLIRMGDLRRAVGEEGLAEASYRAALAVDSRNAAASAGLAASLLAQGRGAEALGLLEPVARNSSDPKLLRNYGVALDMAGRQADAQAAYRRGLAAAPADAALHSNLALSLAVSGDTDGALRAIQMAGAGRPAQAANAVLLLAMAGRDTEARVRGAGMAPDELEALVAQGRQAARAATPGERAAALGVVNVPALSLQRAPGFQGQPAEAPPVVLSAPAPLTDRAAARFAPADPALGRQRRPAPRS